MTHFLILLLGVFFCSTSAVIMKLSELPSALLASYRLLFACIILSPMFLLRWRKYRGKIDAKIFRRCIVPGLLLAIHFISWAWGSRLTYIANASLIINLTPVVMPFLARFLIHEGISKQQILGTGIALVGVFALSYSAVDLDPQYFWGNLICFGSMLAFATYLAYGRVNKDFPSIWLYMIPIYAIASLTCFLFALFTLDTLSVGNWREVSLMLAMAVFPTTLGHIVLNKSMRYFEAQTLSVVNLHQFVFAGLMAWMIFSEIPQLIFFVSAALCITGAIVVVKDREPRNK